MSNLTLEGLLGWSFLRSYHSCSGLTLAQHFARSEDRGARFLRGAGHLHVRVNALFLGDWISRTIRVPQHIARSHERIPLFRILILQPMGRFSLSSLLRMGIAFFNLFLLFQISQPFRRALHCISRLLYFLFPPTPPRSPSVLPSLFSCCLVIKPSSIIFHAFQT